MSGLQGRVDTQPILFAKVWQQPYVNVFKQMGVYDGHHARIQGDVRCVLDPTLNKQVLCLKGSISAANFIELPGPGSTERERKRNPAAARVTALGLTGEYMYIQLRAMADRFFSIHIDVLTVQGLTIRLSISNIFKYIKLMNHGRVLQLPCDFLSTKWTVLALHFPSLLEECSNNVQSMQAFALGNGGEHAAAAANGALKYVYHSVQRIQFCSSLYVKNCLTSNHKYTISTFPKEVRFFVGRSYSYDDFYEWFWIITPPSSKQLLADQAAKREEEMAAKEAGEDDDAGDGEPHSVTRSAAEQSALALVGTSIPVPASEVRSQPGVGGANAGLKARAFDAATSRRESSSAVKACVPVNILPTASYAPASTLPPDVLAASTRGALTAEQQARLERHQPLTTAEFDEEPEVHARPDVPQPQAATSGGSRRDFSEAESKLHPPASAAGSVGSSSSASLGLNGTNLAATLVSADAIQAERERLQATMLAARRREEDEAGLMRASNADTTLVPDPLLELEKIIGYSPSRTSRNLTWSPDGQYMIYPSGNIVIISNVKTGAQEFLTGHTSTVNLVSMASNGVLATGQEGKQAVIRLWNFHMRQCVAILLAHNSDLRCLAFSYLNLMLGAVGRDAQGRLLIVIWDISSVLDTGKIHIVAKQLSDFGINRLVFSPFREDPMHLMSCGHESIRFWRIKTRHLPGSSLQLNEHARNTFTDVAFEAKYGEADQTSKRMYVATASGSLFQINYATRQLECIYKLHSGPIYSISVNEGFCVTGSGDGFLRVWPLGFEDFYLQAQHKGAITSVQISTDGVHVLVGSENGCIGVMDLGSTAYQTRVRSHLDQIYAVAFDPHRDEFATVSRDGTIRIFGLHSLEQIYEFYSPHEVIHAIAYHPLASEYRVACGFASGSMRVMDIPTTSMHVDYQQHTGRVLSVTFAPDGLFLYSAGEDGHICAYDVGKNYLPVRMFTTYRHQPVPLPPSVARVIGQEQEKEKSSGRLKDRLKEDHDSRSPFLSHHLDRARKEERELDFPPEKTQHHSHSHTRHCDPAHYITGGSIGAALPHGHQQRASGPSIVPAHALAISDDGSLLATIGADPTSIVLLSTDTLRQVRLLTTASLPVARIHFVQHSTELAVVLSDQSWQRFNVESGSLMAHIQPQPTMRFKQEKAIGGAAAAAAGAQTTGLAFAAAATGGVSLPVAGGPVCTSSAVSPLNLWLLTGSSESLLRVWDFHSRAHAPHFQSFTAHQNQLQPAEGVTSIQFSPDGRKLITTGGDAIWLWSVRAKETEALDGLKRRVAKRAQEEKTRGMPHSLPTIQPHAPSQLATGYREDEDRQDEREDELNQQSFSHSRGQSHSRSQSQQSHQTPSTREAWGTNSTIAMQQLQQQQQQPSQ